MSEKDSVNLIESMTTWQGEGPSCGKRMLLLRFKSCDMVDSNHPCHFCDTLVRMRTSTEFTVSLNHIQQILNDEKAGLMITGGETTYKHNFTETLQLLTLIDYPIANVETNGHNLKGMIQATKDLNKNIQFIYSPKIFSPEDMERNLTLINEIIHDRRVFIKYVVADEQISDEFLTKLFEQNSSKLDLHQRVYLMPEGKSLEKMIKNSGIVFDMCETFKTQFSSRDHIVFQFI